MANVYTSLATSTTTIAELSAALQSKYASNLTVLHENATDLVFSCALLSSKVIKFTVSSGTKLSVIYGDSWISDTTLLNGVQVFGASYYGSMNVNHLICGDSFILLNTLSGSLYDENTGIILIGKLTNGNSLVSGSSGSSSTSIALSRDVTLGENISIIGIDTGFTSDTGALFKRPVYFQRRNVGLETNSDGTFATLPGLYSASYVTDTFGATKGSSYFMSSTGLFYYLGSGSQNHIKSSLLAEW